MTNICYYHDHLYADPLLSCIEQSVEFQQGYFDDEKALAHFDLEKHEFYLNDEPVIISDEVKEFFIHYYKELHSKPLQKMEVPKRKLILTEKNGLLHLNIEEK